jgi:hypothetical protein
MPAGNRFGRHFVLGAAIGGLMIAGAATALWARGNGGPSSTPRDETAFTVTGGVATSSFRNTPPPPSTVYLVGSEDEAAYLRAAMADSDSIRAAAGLAPLNETVVVVSSEAEADMIRAGVTDASTIRQSTGEPSFDQTVVDLRAE